MFINQIVGNNPVLFLKYLINFFRNDIGVVPYNLIKRLLLNTNWLLLLCFGRRLGGVAAFAATAFGITAFAAFGATAFTAAAFAAAVFTAAFAV